MSRHTFETDRNGQRLEIVLGYDRRLDYFLLTIERLRHSPGAGNSSAIADVVDDEDDAMLYSNLADPNGGFQKDLGYYGQVLSQLKITVPESMFSEVRSDANNHVGNRVVCHNADG
jgi:hypothetical protein